MANKGDIHLTVSETVMGTLSLLSLVYTGAATQPPLLSHPSFTLTIHHMRSQQMRSFSIGHEWWCTVSHITRGAVLGWVSKEFVIGMGILIGPLTLRKSVSDILISRFFSHIQNSNSILHTHTHTHTPPHCLVFWDSFTWTWCIP